MKQTTSSFHTQSLRFAPRRRCSSTLAWRKSPSESSSAFCLFTWADLHMLMSACVCVCVCVSWQPCGVMHSQASTSVGWIWLAVITKPTSGIFLGSLPIAPRRWRGPDSSGSTLKLDQTNLERVFRGSHKRTCRERGEITPTGNHLIMEIISCHGYPSSSDVIGWIHAASGSVGWSVGREEEEGETDGDKLFRFGVVMRHQLASVLSDCDYWQTLCFHFTVYTHSNKMIPVLDERLYFGFC